MECQRVQDLLSLYLRADLPAGEREAVARHVADCAICQHEVTQVQRMDQILHDYLASVPIINRREAVVSRVMRPRVRLAFSRRLVPVLIAIGLLIALTATALAIRNKIIVVEPSREVSGLEEVVQRAHYPLWVPSVGKLTRVREIEEGRHYTVFLDYTLDDGRIFYVREWDGWNLDVRQWVASIPPEDRDMILGQGIDINGYEAVLFLTTRIRASENQTPEPGPPALRWNAGGTGLELTSSLLTAEITGDELIRVAKTMRKIGR
ncbi:MAG: zf-HC2 domain-containing protein [Anaerolineae bacterium]|nr:zf-HC2 domain-containing protein [Anaerolineae bacterium]